MSHSWVKSFPAAITVCDTKGIILEMNDRAIETFKADGGASLIGANVLDCHPEPARTQLAKMLESPAQHVYSIEKNGVKKLIYQSPWYENDQYAGFIEIALPVPVDIPHFIRTP